MSEDLVSAASGAPDGAIDLAVLKEALRHATPQPPWDSPLEVVEHADDTGVDLHGANALLAKYAVNALPALVEVVEAAQAALPWIENYPLSAHQDFHPRWRAIGARLEAALAPFKETPDA